MSQLSSPPTRLAIVTTVYYHLSHAQHMGDRFLVGHPLEGRWHRPNIKVVSLYVDQKPEGDQSADRAKEFGFNVYPTVSEALRCGGGELAVDAILLIGEHGDYPSNEKSQKLYPRYELFKEMVEDAKRLGFPLLAGSSLPVTYRLPEWDLPFGAEIEEALMFGVGSSDAMDYHAMESMQCIVERRKGGETGVKAVQLIEGDEVWQAGEDGRWSKELLGAALSRSDSLMGLSESDGRTQDILGTGRIRELTENPSAYFIEYCDGLRATLLILNGAVKDYCFAARLKNEPAPQSVQFFVTPGPNVTYSACLMSKAEEMFETGIAPYPAERTMIVCGMLESCLTSRVQNHERRETPHLEVVYEAPKESQYVKT